LEKPSPQGICCSETMLKHFLSHQVSGQIQETLIPQKTIWGCLGFNKGEKVLSEIPGKKAG